MFSMDTILQRIMEGEKVRCKDWEEGEFIRFDSKNRMIVDERRVEVPAYLLLMNKDEEWEIVSE